MQILASRSDDFLVKLVWYRCKCSQVRNYSGYGLVPYHNLDQYWPSSMLPYGVSRVYSIIAVTNIASKRQSAHKIDWGSFHDISDKLIIVLQSADLDDANSCFEVSHDRCSETMTAYTNEVPRLCLLGKITCVTYDEYKNQVQHTDCRTPQLYILLHAGISESMCHIPQNIQTANSVYLPPFIRSDIFVHWYCRWRFFLRWRPLANMCINGRVQQTRVKASLDKNSCMATANFNIICTYNECL